MTDYIYSVDSMPGFGDEHYTQRILRVSGTTAYVLAALLHLMLFLFMPDSLFSFSYPEDRDQSLKETTVEYEVLETKPRFVEANPDVPENIPDDTVNESFRSQQAAQENADPLSAERAPQIKGEFEDSQKIVQGDMEKERSMPKLAPGLYGTDPNGELEQSVAHKPVNVSPQIAPVPLPDFILQKPVSKDGPGSSIDDIGKAEKQYPDAKDERIISIHRMPNVEVVEEEISKETMDLAVRQGMPVPLPRPRLKFNVPAGPLMNNPQRTNRTGTVAIDTKYSEFGEYHQRMMEAVSTQWHLLVSRSNYTDGEIKTKVTLEFRLDSKGFVHDMKVLRSTAGHAATLACQDAVLSRAPYGEWTEAMVTRGGDDMSQKITFFYR